MSGWGKVKRKGEGYVGGGGKKGKKKEKKNEEVVYVGGGEKRKEKRKKNNNVMIKTKSKNQNYVPNRIFFTILNSNQD
jgi:hypothetical protein